MEIQKEATEAFVQGLLPEIATRLRIEKYTSLEDAIEKAIRIQTEIKDENERFRRHSHNDDKNPKRWDNRNRNDNPPQDRQNSNGHNNNNRRTDNQTNSPRRYEERRGDLRDRDRERDRNRNQNPENGKTCRYCKKPGHLVEECWKLQARKEYEKRASQRKETETNQARQRTARGRARQQLQIAELIQ
ncbi:putative uncharacterized protein DDB_G0285031 [Ceratina calcarata]|uniref:CCHC-type domain-containing protein n=1 Tax=Ceratina calcarata TaxID=156304 RepID=A0AAJ7J293_9HYME|nr:putative uncharacterized protein DDB_G0285031 [Ceratina calcarata]